jgi:hypothetical protein
MRRERPLARPAQRQGRCRSRSCRRWEPRSTDRTIGWRARRTRMLTGTSRRRRPCRETSCFSGPETSTRCTGRPALCRPDRKPAAERVPSSLLRPLTDVVPTLRRAPTTRRRRRRVLAQPAYRGGRGIREQHAPVRGNGRGCNARDRRREEPFRAVQTGGEHAYARRTRSLSSSLSRG